MARNRVQHPESITSHSSNFSDKDLKKVPAPFFIDAREAELIESTEQNERTWLIPPTIHVSSEKLNLAIAEIRSFCTWLEGTDH